MIRFNILLLLFLVAGPLLAQDQPQETEKDTTYWTFSNQFGANFNFSDFSDNWTGGGTDAISLSSFLNSKASYRKGNYRFTSTLELLYGIQRQNNGNVELRKTQDKIFFNNKLGYSMNEHWDMSANLQFLTQFDNGFRFPDNAEPQLISAFMAPAFLTGSLGFSYDPNESFTLSLSPFAPRLTFVLDTTIYRNVPENYGVDIGSQVRYEWYAFQLIADYQEDVNDNLNVKIRYQLFANYEELDQIESIDHRLDVAVTAEVTKYISINISTISIYDIDQIDEIQASTILGLGLLVKF